MSLIGKSKTSNNRSNVCFGKKCNNKGNRLLTIKYVHKSGWFCEKCAEELILNELVEDVKQRK
jgi:hypothetical protein